MLSGLRFKKDHSSVLACCCPFTRNHTQYHVVLKWLVSQQKIYHQLFWQPINCLSYLFKKNAKHSVSSFSKVRICCFSMFYMTLNWISFGLLVGQNPQSDVTVGNHDWQSLFSDILYMINRQLQPKYYCQPHFKAGLRIPTSRQPLVSSYFTTVHHTACRDLQFAWDGKFK